MKYTVEDAKRWADEHCEVDLTEISITYLDTRHRFVENSLIWISAVYGGVVIGHLSITPTVAQPGQPDTWWINDLFVREEGRRKGIARRLVRFACNYAASQADCATIAAGINRNNTASLSLFQREHFQLAYCYPDSEALLFSRPVDKQAIDLHQN